MPDEYGLKVWMDLIPKNLKSVTKQIEQSFAKVDVGLSGGKSAGGGSAGSGAGGLASSGLKGAAMLGGVLIAVNETVKYLKKIWNNLKESSPYLRGILSLFSRSMSYFFKPYGDFLAGLLKPLAILMMKMAVSWMKFTRTPVGKKVVEGTASASFGGLGIITFQIKTIKDIFSTAAEIAKEIDWGNLWEKTKLTFSSMWDQLKGFGSWLWEGIKTNLSDGWDLLKDLGSWLWGKLEDLWDGTVGAFLSVNDWIADKLEGIFGTGFGGFDSISAWAYNKISSLWKGSSSAGGSSSGSSGGIVANLANKVSSFFSGTGSSSAGSSGNSNSGVNTDWLPGYATKFTGHQTGLNFVPNTGYYKLHRGEKVTNASQAGKGGGKNITINNTFNMSGGGYKSGDMERNAVRSSRIIELELRGRGL